MNVFHALVTQVKIFRLAKVICIRVVGAEYIISSFWVKVCTKIAVWVFCFLLGKPQCIIKLSYKKPKMSALETVGDKIQGVEIELDPLVKIEGGVKLLNQFNVCSRGIKRKVTPAGGVDKSQNTRFDAEGVESEILYGFT